jgi:hypothetical protein
MRTEYAVIRLDDSEDHVMSTTQTSLRDANKFVTFLRKEDPDGTFLIAKIVAIRSKPRRWRLE